MTANNLMETAFNIAYLLAIYLIVIMTAVRLKKGEAIDNRIAVLFLLAFALLAIGDTGHVGFRVIAYLNGGLEANRILVGAGNLATAQTVTVFYMLFFQLLYRYISKKRNLLFWFVICLGIIRMIFMLFPGNNWGGEIPLGFSYIRNALLTIMGIIIAVRYVAEGQRRQDGTLRLFGIFIIISYAFYLPVILFVHLAPMIGMLMIPKTCAYVAIALLGYRRLFTKRSD